MTEHGFGKATIESGGNPSQDIILKFARKISKVPGVIRTHTQNPEGSRGMRPEGEWQVNHIIFEFGHVLTNYPDLYKKHEDFFDEIKGIVVQGHRITTLEPWFIRDSVP